MDGLVTSKDLWKGEGQREEVLRSTGDTDWDYRSSQRRCAAVQFRCGRGRRLADAKCPRRRRSLTERRSRSARAARPIDGAGAVTRRRQGAARRVHVLPDLGGERDELLGAIRWVRFCAAGVVEIDDELDEERLGRSRRASSSGG